MSDLSRTIQEFTNAMLAAGLLPDDAIIADGAIHAFHVADVALFLDLPISTIDKLRGQGKGPKCFKLGRRLYVRQADLRDWLDAMALSEAA